MAEKSNLNIPNILSISRIFMAPLIIWGMMQGEHAFVFWVLILAAITDGLDGYWARKFHQETAVGGALDPFADKVLVISVFLTFGVYLGLFPLWFTLLVIGRDALIMAGVLSLWAVKKETAMRPSLISKVNTVLLFILLLLQVSTTVFEFSLDLTWLIYVIALTTIISSAGYVKEWLKRI
jgi:cardiolipin synthase